jgi:hypothetical protein
MAYTRNFGMRGFENVIRDGRFRVPATGNPLVIGSPVQLDSANPGRLVQCAAAAVPGQNAGVVVFEHIIYRSDTLVTHIDAPYDTVPLGQYAQMMHGPGAKVWFRNTAAKTLYDGRVRAAVTPVAGNLTTFVPGDTLAVAAGGTWAKSATAPWFVIEQVVVPDPAVNTVGLVEARFIF